MKDGSSMRGRIPYNDVIVARVFQLRRRVKLDTQKLRTKTIKKLERLFDSASAIARGEVEYQSVEGKVHPISLKERQGWVRVAAYVAQIMQNISNGFDEKQIDEDMAELEKLVNEASKKGQAETVEAAVGSAPVK